MITKVVIAAAGQGTRMLELSKDKSKHLIEVKSRPFLAYVLDRLVSAGYHDIILVVGFGAQLMEEFAKNYVASAENGEKLKIETVDQHKILGPKAKIYGTACPLMCVNPVRNRSASEISNGVKDKIGNENFIYLYGDNLFSKRDLKSMNIDDNFCYIAGLKHENPEKYGVLIRNGEDFLEKIIEKPKEFVGDLINAGLYKFTSDVFEKLDKIEKSPRGEYEITDAISLLAQQRKVKIKQIEDYWLDFGNPLDIEKASKFIEEHGNN